MAQMCSTTPKTIRMGTFSVMRIASAHRQRCSTSHLSARFLGFDVDHQTGNDNI
tara:strand:+ start:144 stop:305 length:162 start_codon:yes stop_codon:yes gene_type:complete